MKACIIKLKESEEYLISVYKSISNNDLLNEQLKNLQDQFESLNQELESTKRLNERCGLCCSKDEPEHLLKSKENPSKKDRNYFDYEKNFYEQGIKDLKSSYKLGTNSKIISLESELVMKQKEINNLSSQIIQRDKLLEKAGNLIISLNEQWSRKNGPIKTSENKSVDYDQHLELIRENQRLTESLQTLQKSLEVHENSEKTSFFNKLGPHDFEFESFGSKNLPNPNNTRPESDISYLEEKISQLKIKINEITSENVQLNETIKSLEIKYSELSLEKHKLSDTLSNTYEIIEEYKSRLAIIENQKNSSGISFSQSIEDLSKLLIQKEMVITDLTAQVMSTLKHKKKHRQSNSKDPSEFIEFFQEILALLLDCAKGKIKEKIQNTLENLENFQQKTILNQVLGYIKTLCIGKLDVYSLLQDLYTSLNSASESVQVVVSKLDQIKKNIPKDNEFCIKVIDLTLSFFKNFSKERETDYQLVCQLIKIISNV